MAAFAYLFDVEQAVNTIRSVNQFRTTLPSVCILLAFTLGPALSAEPAMRDHMASDNPAQQDVSCVPVAERTGRKLGCFVTYTELLGKLPQIPLYWHLHKYKTRQSAESAKESHSSVVDSFGDVWLFTIAPEGWNAKGGERIARVGPLPITDAVSYTVEYMEASFAPGMRSRVHRHPGPEAWYVLSGEQCLETPGRRVVVKAGEGAVVPEGPPMQLFGTGQSERRTLVVILHDSSKPMSMLATDWKPSGLCESTSATNSP